ncbi:MAG: nucleotide exchange factor GrpE [Chloroflexi bacterium]|nr:nucleotide exchange factor GrpE [Chloroflexota bacterium]
MDRRSLGLRRPRGRERHGRRARPDAHALRAHHPARPLLLFAHLGPPAGGRELAAPAQRHVRKVTTLPPDDAEQPIAAVDDDAVGAVGGEDDTVQDEPLDDAERIARLEAEVAELKDAHARAQADLLNYRRRSEQRWAERARATLADTVRRYIPLLDDIDLALGNVDDELDGHQWVEGIRLVRQKFVETLATAGVEAIATEDAEFDPRVHEAISYAPGPDGRVVAAVRSGYTMQDYVVRPAQVVVGDGSVNTQATQEA